MKNCELEAQGKDGSTGKEREPGTEIFVVEAAFGIMCTHLDLINGETKGQEESNLTEDNNITRAEHGKASGP